MASFLEVSRIIRIHVSHTLGNDTAQAVIPGVRPCLVKTSTTSHVRSAFHLESCNGHGFVEALSFVPPLLATQRDDLLFDALRL